MDDLKPLAVFAETVDAGSMSAAARRLGMSPSAVSQTIRALEAQGGVALLHRSTRKLALTEAGARYYPHCKRLLEAAQAAAESLQQARAAPTGELRVSAPVGFSMHLGPAFAGLLAEAPQLRLRMVLDDTMIDLIDARIDVALRFGQLADSDWFARRLGDVEMILCAAPVYLNRHGVPAAPDDLAAHDWLALDHESASGAPARIAMALTSTDDGARHNREIVVQARIASNNQMALQQMCEHGLGIARLSRADAGAALRSGALVQVLGGWRLPPLPIWVLTPRRDERSAKVRAALAALKRYFATSFTA